MNVEINKADGLELLIEQALIILKSLGLPIDENTHRRRERIAKAFLLLTSAPPSPSF